MPRQSTETLVGYQFRVERGERPVPVQAMDEQVVVELKTMPVTVLHLLDPAGGHHVVVPFEEEARLELVRQLTSGVVLA